MAIAEHSSDSKCAICESLVAARERELHRKISLRKADISLPDFNWITTYTCSVQRRRRKVQDSSLLINSQPSY